MIPKKSGDKHMKVKCEYCESFIDDSEDFCPNCGAVNANMKRVANGVPTTIEELKAFCVEHNLPLSLMRFYIGEDYKLPKAFGIYKDEDSGEFIVYKNKSDGSRAIRYQGLDEAYAVNEIYLKLQVEMQKQEARKIAQMQSSAQNRSDYSNRTSNSDYSNRTNNSNYHETTSSSRSSRSSGNKLKKRIILIIVLIFFGSSIIEMLFAGMIGAMSIFTSSGSDYDSSYSSDYDYDDDYDYSYNYNYDYSYDSDDWDTDWDSDWDSDYDWDSGSDWDSSFSDWDSDW